MLLDKATELRVFVAVSGTLQRVRCKAAGGFLTRLHGVLAVVINSIFKKQ